MQSPHLRGTVIQLGETQLERPMIRFDATTFESDGLAILRRCVNAARVQALRDAIGRQIERSPEPAEYEADLHYPGAPASRDAAGGSTIRRLLQAYARGEPFQGLARDPTIVSALHSLLGAQVALSQAHHNCIMTKQPRYSSSTGWHQDLRYWAFSRGQLVSSWLALGREVADNGALMFIPGSHRMELALDRFDEARFLREDLPENRALIDTRVAPELEPGDVVLFHCRTLHAAGMNRTAQAKWSLVFTYHAADDHPLPGTRSASLPSVPLQDA
jgi:phytanoyl-CoA hydroxylase